MGGCVSSTAAPVTNPNTTASTDPSKSNSKDIPAAIAPANNSTTTIQKEVKAANGNADQPNKPIVPSLGPLSITIPSSAIVTPSGANTATAPLSGTPESRFLSLCVVCSNCEELSAGLTVWCKDCGAATLAVQAQKGGSGANTARSHSSHHGHGHAHAHGHHPPHHDQKVPSPRHLDDGIHPPVLCGNCDKELHKFAKTSSHMRTAVNFHRSKLKSAKHYGFTTGQFPLKIPDGLDELSCNNCDSDDIHAFCYECKSFFCLDCSRDLHLPKVMKHHHLKIVKKQFVYVKNPSSDMMSMRLASNRNKKKEKEKDKDKGNDGGGGNSLFFEAMAEVERNEAAAAEKKRNELIAAKARAAAAAAHAVPVSASVDTTDSESESSAAASSAAPDSPSSIPDDDTNDLPDIKPDKNTGSQGDCLQIHEFSTAGSLSIQELELRNLINPFDSIGSVAIVQLSVGSHHCGAVSSYGSLFMWGSNHNGELGIGDLEDGEKDTKIPQLVVFPQHKPVKQVQCGHTHTMVLCQTGEVYTWGSGLMGILGHTSDADLNRPKKLNLHKNVKRVSGETVISLAAGSQNSAAIVTGRSDGQLFIWGEGSAIGNGQFKPQITPVLTAVRDSKGNLPELIQVAFGRRHCLALTKDGEVYSWGSNEFGQGGYPQVDSPSGTGQTEANLQLTPKRIDYFVSIGRKIVQIACGERHSSVVTDRGEIYSFGSGETHQCGIMDNVDQFIPVLASSLVEQRVRIVNISIGTSVSIGVGENGLCYGWGYGLEQPIPTVIEGLKGHFLQYCGIGDNEFCVALTKMTKSLYEWQFDGEATGEEEEEDETARNGEDDGKPATIAEGDEEEEEGEGNGDGDDEAGGDGGFDILDYQPPQVGNPVMNRSLRGKQLISISAGKTHYGAVTADGKLYMWGSNAEFQLGISFDSERVEYKKPVEIPVESHSIVEIQCSVEHSLALTSEGSVLSWGTGGEGRLGLNSDEDQPDPTLIPFFLDQKISIAAISVGPVNCGAISSQGNLYLWGAGGSGQLGNGDSLPQFEPQFCSSLKHEKIASIQFGNCHTLVLTVNGKLYTMGDNRFGQLGQGGTGFEEDFSATPLRISIPGIDVDIDISKDSKLRPIQIQCGDNVSMVLLNSGEVWGWGSGETNQICLHRIQDIQSNGGLDDEKAGEDHHYPKKCVFPFYTAQNSTAPMEKSVDSIDSNTNTNTNSNNIVKIVSFSVRDINCAALCNDGSVWRWGWDFGTVPSRLTLKDKKDKDTTTESKDKDKEKEKEVAIEWKQVTLGYKRMLLIA